MHLGAMNNPAQEILSEIKSFAEMGFEYVEIAIEGPRALPEELIKKKKQIKNLLAGNDIFAIAHMPWYFEIGHPYESIRRAFLKETFKIVDTAAKLELELLGVHIMPLKGLYKDKKLECNIAALKEVLRHAKKRGVSICVENLDVEAFSIKDFKTIFAALPELKFLLDVGHANMNAKDGEAIFDFIDSFSGRLAHVHAHDNDGSDDQHLPIGAGNIHWKKVVRALKKNYDGTVTLEIHSQDRDYLRISKEKFQRLWKGQARPNRIK